MSEKTGTLIISPEVFKILANVNASRNDIESLKSKMSEEIILKLTAVANAVYLGTLRRGSTGTFYDVVNCIGMERAKALIILFSNYLQGMQYPDVEVIFARSYATSIMAMIIAVQMGFREDAVRKAELCSLYLEIGKKVMTLYRKIYPDDSTILTDDFISLYHPYLGEKIAVRYSLPDYIKRVILAGNIIMEEEHISIAGIVQMAHDSVQASFQRHQNRLVIKCQVPRPATDVTRTLEAIITEKFNAVGLDKYLHIIRIPRIYEL
ncbi:MAG: hypothetical protein PHN75_05100 [Syntrophales bacterium]|nr:hypothetical protein [Syntrophales bacterium]